MQESALKRRLTPSIPFTLHVENEDESSFSIDLKLAFNMNVVAAIRERTKYNLLGDLFGWIDDPKAIIVVLWAASLPYQPEYDSDEGLLAIGEYLKVEQLVDAIEALCNAYAFFVRKEKRDAYVGVAKTLIESLRTGKEPKARPSTESETTNPASPSTSTTLQISPNQTSDSQSSNSENSQPIASIAS